MKSVIKSNCRTIYTQLTLSSEILSYLVVHLWQNKSKLYVQSRKPRLEREVATQMAELLAFLACGRSVGHLRTRPDSYTHTFIHTSLGITSVSIHLPFSTHYVTHTHTRPREQSFT